MRHRVRVQGLCAFVDRARLLGPGSWQALPERDGVLCAEAELDTQAAADLAARLRGVGLGGERLVLEVEPALPRTVVRAARTDEAKRYRQGSAGFTRPGVRLDAEGRRSLTPEALALELGRRARRARVIDACAGAGGNAIGFARAGCDVVAIERDAERLAQARHNARLYGVAERIELLRGDARALLPAQRGDVLFVDPPWGERYDKLRVTADDLPLVGELLALAGSFPRVWLKLPPSFDPRTLPGFAPSAWFGVGEGDRRRVKFLLLERAARPERQALEASSSKRATGSSARRVRSTAKRPASDGGASENGTR